MSKLDQLKEIILLCIQINQLDNGIVKAKFELEEYVSSKAMSVKVDINGASYTPIKSLKAKFGTTIYDEDLTPMVVELQQIKAWSAKGIESLPKTSSRTIYIPSYRENKKIQPLLLAIKKGEKRVVDRKEYYYSSIMTSAKTLKAKNIGEWKVVLNADNIEITRLD